ncbi:hypothetical protein Cgig2_028423 [Carnegiea gigantea]|uniref:Hexosyltransferase n=1 Tax=Carnegiea gigantea TaxID=171969 RepID=A0A9Q1JJ66_9CARY|nr:hypothetical protein Cgig2_028423 [Carnegiea gigantea]
MSKLKAEVSLHDDFILLDIEEEYSKLPYKTLAFFKAAYALFDSEFYVKADDDIYLRPVFHKYHILSISSKLVEEALDALVVLNISLDIEFTAEMLEQGSKSHSVHEIFSKFDVIHQNTYVAYLSVNCKVTRKEKKQEQCQFIIVILVIVSWYEPLAYLLGKEYFLHAYGPIYALSAKVVRSLVSLRNDRQVAIERY